MNIKRIRLVVIFLLYVLQATPSEINFYHLTRQDGLSESTVYCIIKDSYGYFWFGTANGLNRWDGYSFRVYSKTNDVNSLQDNSIVDLLEDKYNNLWIATSEGVLSLYRNEYDDFVNFALSDEFPGKSFSITDIELYGDDLIVATSKNGLFRFNIYDKEFSKIDLIDNKNTPISSINITSLCFDSDSVLWIGTGDGVFKSDSYNLLEKYPVMNCKLVIKDQQVRKVYSDSYGFVWFGTHTNGLFACNKNNLSIKHYEAGPENGNSVNQPIIRDIKNDLEGNLWIGTGGGGINIFNYKTQKFSYYKSELGNQLTINSDIIYCLATDDQHNMWVGTFNGGVNYTNSYKQRFNLIRSFGGQNSLTNNSILSFCDVGDGNLWVGTDGGGINIFNPETNSFNYFSIPIKGVSGGNNIVIKSMKYDGKNKIYIGTYRDGLYIYDLEKKEFKYKFVSDNPQSITSNDIWAIEISKKTGEVWIATLGGGILKYIPEKDIFVRCTISNKGLDNSPELIFNSLFIDKDENIWLGSGNSGLYKLIFNENGDYSSINYNDESNFSSRFINAIYQDSKNQIWIGTRDAGLFLFDSTTSKFCVFNQDDNLSGNNVEGILEGTDGNLWISTNNGISCMLYDEKGSVTFQNYNYLDGLQSNEFNANSAFKCSDGNLYFGGVSGFNYFNPKNLNIPSEVGKTVIVGFTINDIFIHPNEENGILEKSIELTDKIKLNYRQSNISFIFTLLDYNVPQKNTYKYRLVPFEEDWVLGSNRRRVNYTNLDPGVYTFEVVGINAFDAESLTPAVIQIEITPPFWSTLFFKIVIILFTGSLLLIIFNLRVRSFRIQGDLLKKMVDKRTSELKNLNKVLEERNIEVKKQSDILRLQRADLIKANENLELSNAKIAKQNTELEEHRNNLEELVRKRTYELEVAKTKAEESEQLKMAFLSNMSHEIRTPMNAIVGFASLLDDNTLTYEDRNEYIRQISINSESLLILIDDILDLSKIEANQLNIVKSVFDFKSFLKEVFINWNHIHIYDNDKIKFKYENNLNDKSIFIYSDPHRLRQIVNNLLDNAFKFTSEGYVKLVVNKTGEAFVIEVSDTGIGIPENKIDYIFERFRKVDETGTKLFRGAGLGLAISNKLAHMLGCKISVKSTVESGTSFYLQIPLSYIKDNKEGKQENKIIRFDKPDNLQNKKILIVEDEEANYYYLEGVLLKYGVLLDWAHDGEEAIKMASVSDYDIILMDIKLPVMNGIQATVQIKQMFPEQVVIAQTAFARPEEEEEYRAAGFDDYITKPIKPDLLINIISHYIKSY